MKEYSFQLTPKEVRELCLRAIWERLLLHRAKGLLLLALLALECVLSLWTVMLSTVMLALLLFAALTVLNIIVTKRQLCGRTRTINVEDGMLKQDIGGELQSEIPCSSITKVRKTRHLLMLGLHQASKVIAWYPIPLRVFADEQELDSLVETIKNPQAAEDPMTSSVKDDGVSEAENPEREYFSASSQVGEEEWIRVMAVATEILQAGTLGGQKKSQVWIVLAGIASIFGFLWSSQGASLSVYIVSFMGAMIILALIRNLAEKPEKRIRAQLRKGNMQDNVRGVWTSSVTERGIRQNISGKKNILLPWESLFCMVETDTELFFYQKDKKHFSFLLKNGMESREQMEALKELCREKHVEILVRKQKKYAPDWFFPLLTAVVIAGYVIVGFRQISGDFWRTPAPAYVPFDEQVSVLRSFGFGISGEMEEALGAYMEENDVASYVEHYPYTWLLSNLAGGAWEEQALDSTEVFWFDFEGWDISTDYIRVLEGMQKISAGSILDGIVNIREDTENVNWERGTGTITVSLEWNGQEYSWGMDVQSDWIDAEVLGIYNGLLEKEEVSERFYMTGDDGQGAFVFYCTGEWASAFEDATGLDLETYMVKKGW